MSTGFPVRRASLALTLVASTLLAACGLAPLPSVGGQAKVGALAAKTPHTSPDGRRYGLIFDAQTPKVRWTPGDLNAGIPPKVDLRAKMSPIEDQGTMNACTGFAITGLAEYRSRQEHRATDLSPGFIYVWELKIENRPGQDEGAHIATGMQVLKDKGISPLERFPFLTAEEQKNADTVTSYLTKLPSLAVMQAAHAYAVPEVTAVQDLAAFKVAIAKGKPVVFGIGCYKSFESDAVKKTGVVPMPDQQTEPYVGGHAILAVGYDDSKQQVIFRNSYTAQWGDKGYGYLPYTYFKEGLVGDAWQAD